MNPKPFRLILTPTQSAAIRESGMGFAAGSPVDLRVPTGQCALLLWECDSATANAACGVVMGTHRAIRKQLKAPTTKQK